MQPFLATIKQCFTACQHNIVNLPHRECCSKWSQERRKPIASRQSFTSIIFHSVDTSSNPGRVAIAHLTHPNLSKASQVIRSVLSIYTAHERIRMLVRLPMPSEFMWVVLAAAPRRGASDNTTHSRGQTHCYNRMSSRSTGRRLTCSSAVLSASSGLLLKRLMSLMFPKVDLRYLEQSFEHGQGHAIAPRA